MTNRDRLCYALVIAFGVCLLSITLFFQFGYMIGEKQAGETLTDIPFIRNEPIDPAKQKLLLLDEPSPVIRGIEIAVAVGMIVLGSERLMTYKRRTQK